MITKLYRNEKTTAYKLAKEIMIDTLDIAGYWEEKSGVDLDKLTAAEKDEIHRHVNKLIERLAKQLSK
jgi:hypothetical protein